MKRSRNRSRLLIASACVVACGLALVAACKREERGLRVDAPSASRIESKTLSDLRPGNPQVVPAKNEFEENAYAMSEGKRLFEWYNCVGCHAHGGGGMGPPLMDEKWVYGSEPPQIFSTIVGGRPNGMPSFRGKVPDYQVWQLVSYVRSMSRLVPKDVAPGRRDSLSAKEPEAVTEPKPPQPAQKPQ